MEYLSIYAITSGAGSRSSGIFGRVAGGPRLFKAIVLATLMLASLAGASDPEIIRSRVPAKDVSRWFPAGAELRVMPVKQFDVLVQDAIAGSSLMRSAHPPRLIRARHKARWLSGVLSGHTELVVELASSGPAEFPLEPWTPAIIPTAGSIKILGAHDSGKPGVWIDEAPYQTVELDWELTPRSFSRGRSYKLDLPGNESTVLELDIPKDWIASYLHGRRRRLRAGNGPDRQLWEVEAESGRIEIRLYSPEPGRTLVEPGLWISGSTEIDLRSTPNRGSRLVNCTTDWTVDLDPRNPKPLVVAVDPGLELIDVQGTGVSGYSLRGSGTNVQVIVNLGESTKPTTAVRFLGHAKLPGEGGWTIPAIRPLDATWTGGRTTVILDKFHVVHEIKETDARQIFPTEGETGSSKRLVFESNSARSVGQIVFGEARDISSCVVRGQMFLADAPSRLECQLDLEFHKGPRMGLAIDLSKGWIPENVQIRGGNERLSWHPSILPSGDVRLSVSLEATAVERKDLRLLVRASSNAAGPTGPLDLPRVRPVDTRVADEAWLAWTDRQTMIHPSQAGGLAWIDPGEVAGFVTPPGPGWSLRNALAWRWIADTAAGRLERQRIEQEPSATARSRASLDSNGRRLMLDGSLVVQAGARTLDSIPVWINEPKRAVEGWRFEDQSGGDAPMLTPLEPAARQHWQFPEEGSAWNLHVRVASQTRKTVRFHREQAWNSAGPVPLLAISPRYSFRGTVAIEAPVILHYRAKSTGLRRLDESVLDQPATEPDLEVLEGAREERNQRKHVDHSIFAYEKPGGRLELVTEPLETVQPAIIIREAVLTTTVDRNGQLLNRLRLLALTGQSAALDFTLPAGLSLLRVRRDGGDVTAIRSGPRLSIPLPVSSQGSRSSTIVIDFLTENGRVGDGYQLRPTIPEIAVPCLLFVWEVNAPQGWRASDSGLSWMASDRAGAGPWPSAALGLWKPAWDSLPGTSRHSDEELLSALDGSLANSISAELTLAEVFSRWDSGLRAVVVDRTALSSSGIGPRTLCVPGRAQVHGRHVSLATLEQHGLALVPFEDTLVITAAAVLPEFEPRIRWIRAIAESLAWGSDRTDRFQTVARWRQGPSPKISSTTADELGERIKRLEGWSTYRFAGTSWPAESSFVYLVDLRARILTGWIIAGLWLLAWPWCRHNLDRHRFAVLTAVMTGSLLFSVVLPARNANVTAGLFVGSLAILIVELGGIVARPFGDGRRGGRTESSLVRRAAGTAVVSSLFFFVVAGLALGQSAAGRSSAILALFPYEGSFDPSQPPESVILRLSDFDRLTRLATVKAPVATRSVRAVAVLHRVTRKSARDVVVESEFDLIAAGEPPFFWRVPVFQSRDIEARLDRQRIPILIEPGGTAGTVTLSRPGKHTLRIRRSTATRTESGFETLRMPVNAMPSARVIVERGTDDPTLGDVTGYGMVTADANRSLSGHLGPVDKLEVRWTAPAPVAAQRTAGIVDGLILWDINPAGDRILARLTYHQQQTLTAISLSHQRGLMLRSAQVRGSAEPVCVENGGAGEWILHFDPPLEAGVVVELDCWMPFVGRRDVDRVTPKSVASSEGIRELPELRPAGAERYSGSLGVRRPGDWTGRFEPPPGGDPISDESFVKSWGNLPGEPLTLCGTSRFVGECRASIPTGPAPTKIVVKPTVAIQLESGRMSMVVDAELAENSGHLSRLEANLPEGLTLTGIASAGLADWTITPDHRLHLTFDRSVAAQRRKLQLAGWIPLSEDPLKISSRRHRIALPWIEWDNLESQVGILTISSITKPDVSRSPGLSLISSESSGAGGTMPSRHRLTYRVDDSRRLGEIVWESAPAQVSVSIESQVTIHPDTAEWVAVLRYDVLGGSLDAIRLKLPSDWASTAELHLAGSQYQLTTETRDQSTFWTVTPERPIWGTQRFVLRSSHPLGSDREIVHPDVSPLGRGKVDAELRIINANGRPLTIESFAGLDQVADTGRFRAREFVTEVGSPIGVFRVSRESWILRVQRSGVAMEAGSSQGNSARLSFADLMVEALPDRSTLGCALYETVAGTGSEVSIALPERSSILWAMVDSNPTTLLKSASGIWSARLDANRQSRVGVIWRTEPRQSQSRAAWPIELPGAGSGPVPTVITAYTPVPSVVEGKLGGFEVVSAAGLEMARADWLGRSIENFTTTLDRSSGRDHEKLASLLINRELALRSAERSSRRAEPAIAAADENRVGQIAEMIRTSRAAALELIRRTRLADDLAAAKRYLGEQTADPARRSAGVPEPSVLDGIEAIGHPTALLGTLPGVDELSRRATIQLVASPWDEPNPSRPGRAIVVITLLLLAIAFIQISRFRGFWINRLALLAALGLAAYSGGPLLLAGGLGLALAGWRKERT
jgi:hypothetical protein